MGELLSTAALILAGAQDLEALPLEVENELDGIDAGPEALYSVREVLEVLDTINEARRVLDSVARDLADHAGERWPCDEEGELLPFVEVPGLAAFERHARRDGKDKIKDEELLYARVRDTRVVDPATGEVLDTIEVLTRAYGSKSRETGRVRLTGTSRSKLEALGFTKEELDEHFERNPRTGWTIQKR